MRAVTRFALLVLLLSVVSTWSWLLALVVTGWAWLLLGGHRTLYLAYHTVQRDAQ